ncbi:rhodanese-like domain-containing protein [Candidatus Babeliales bacterium]|nr:rhodanese-like domain-containing protein [Candidatus Babeliales bacterium]
MHLKKTLFVCSLLLLALPGCFESCQRSGDEVVYYPSDLSLETDIALVNQNIFELDAQSLREIIRTAWEETKIRDFKDLEEFAVIDVRGYDLYVQQRIRGAVNVELKDLKHEASRWELARKLIVYSNDNKCLLAKKAAQRLASYGFKKVFVYSGGMSEWFNMGFEVD